MVERTDEIIPHSLGLEVQTEEAVLMDVIVPKNSTLPASFEKEYQTVYNY